MTEWILTSSAMILVVIALRGLLKDKLRPLIRYCLWGVVLARLLLPFPLFESTISLSNAIQPLTQQTGAAVEQYEAAYDRVVQQQIQSGITATPAQTREEVRQQVYDDTYAALADRYTQQGITIPEARLRQEAQTQAQTIDMLALVLGMLPGIRYTGMALMALILLGSNAWFAWNLHRSRVPLSQPGYPLPVFETADAATPCLFGLIRPGVYLTPEASRNPDMTRHVLAHELTHYRHADHIWSVLRGVCLVLHWYNPLVWAAAVLSRQDSELACDEATIRTLGEEERIPYGKTLVGMTCIRRDPKSFLITATTMVGSGNTLKERITAIARKPGNAVLAVIACVLVLAIAAGCTFTGAPTEPTEPTEPSEPTGPISDGQLSRAAVQVNGRLYLFLGGMNAGSVPSGYELAGTITHQDRGAIPTAELHGTLPVGTEIYTHPLNHRYIYYRSVSGEESDVRQMERIDYAGYSIYALTGSESDSRFPVLYPDTPATAPDHQDCFIYSSDPDWHLHDELRDRGCQDGYLYTWHPQGDRSVTQLSDEPVLCYTAVYNSVFCFTESGKLIQTDFYGYPQRVLYAAGEPASLAYHYPNLYFTDGADLIVLDVTTGNATVAGNFENCRFIQPVTNTWLWVYAQGNDYAYDTVTRKLVPLLTEDALDRFLAGEWPDATADLPEDYTLSDVVTASEEEISWKCSMGHDHTLSVSLPKITPYSDRAISLQNRIDTDWKMLIEEARNCKETATCPAILHTDFEASLTQNLLSIMIHARWDHDYDSYEVYNMDTVTGYYLRPADMVRRYLNVSYPEFIQAVCQFRLDELQSSHPSINIRDDIAYLVPEVTALNRSALYVNPDGILMLRYDALSLGGADFYPTVTPFPQDLEFSGAEAAYAWLFGLYDPAAWEWDSTLEDYWTIIQDTYAADIDTFEEQLSKADAQTQKDIWHIVSNPCPSPET